jgi:hypothetical protein
MHRQLFLAPFSQRTTRSSENLFPRGDFSKCIASAQEPDHSNGKAGIDPVGASYPKVRCPPQAASYTGRGENHAYSQYQRT